MRRGLIATLCALAGCDRVLGFDPIHPRPDASSDTPAADSSPDASPMDGLVAHYTFEMVGPPAACAADVTGLGHDAACVTGMPTVVPGRIGNAFMFDGATDLHVADAPDLDSTTAWTVAFWVQQSSRADTECPVNRPFGASADSWQFCLFSFNDTYFAAGSFSMSGSYVSADQWHHIAMTWNDPTVTVFVDGVVLYVADGTVIAFDSHGMELGVDIDSGTADVAYIGLLDDLRIYNRALSAEDILLLEQ